MLLNGYTILFFWGRKTDAFLKNLLHSSLNSVPFACTNFLSGNQYATFPFISRAMAI